MRTLFVAVVTIAGVAAVTFFLKGLSREMNLQSFAGLVLGGVAVLFAIYWLIDRRDAKRAARATESLAAPERPIPDRGSVTLSQADYRDTTASDARAKHGP